jgi:hypothetical protein
MSELLANHFSLMSAFCVSSSDGTEGHRKSTFSAQNMEFHHPMSKSIVSSADNTEDQTISTNSMDLNPHISQSCVLSTESTDAQPISTHPVQPVEISLSTVKSGLYAAAESFVDALSSALFIVAVDFSRISALNCILPGHQYIQSGRYWLTLEDLTCPSHRFSELHYQAPYMFVQLIYHIIPLGLMIVAWPNRHPIISALRLMSVAMSQNQPIDAVLLSTVCEPDVLDGKDCFELALQIL